MHITQLSLFILAQGRTMRILLVIFIVLIVAFICVQHYTIKYLSVDASYFSALGSMLGGVGAWFYAILSTIIAYLLYKLQKNIDKKNDWNTDTNLKILMFEKRYSVYSCFIKYYELRLFFRTHSKLNENALISIEQLASSALYRKANFTESPQTNIDFFLQCVNPIQKEDTRTIELSKFCFEKEISEQIIQLIKNISIFTLNYYIPNESFNRNKSLTDIVALYDKIEAQKVLEDMEKNITIPDKLSA